MYKPKKKEAAGTKESSPDNWFISHFQLFDFNFAYS
jgi:hypothetical protein